MLTVRANAKINWSLAITGLRADGYHELDMLMQSISLCDTLTFEPDDALSLSIDGGPAGWDEKNLVCRAAARLRDACGTAQGARVTLEKRIPAMAGLGGGSADGAATLLALNRLWNARLSMDELLEIGLSLGADLPFCLTGGLQRVRGIGEKLEALTAPPSPGLILIMPDEGLSTGAVFTRYDAAPSPLPTDNAAAAQALCAGDFARLDALAFNDLAAPAIALNPAVGAAIDDMRSCGARFARMSGSGSCCFGVFDEPAKALDALKARWPRVWSVETRPCGVEFCE